MIEQNKITQHDADLISTTSTKVIELMMANFKDTDMGDVAMMQVLMCAMAINGYVTLYEIGLANFESKEEYISEVKKSLSDQIDESFKKVSDRSE